MEYHILNEKSVIDFINTLDAVNAYLGTGEKIAKEIGDGNLNLVFVVSNPASRKSIVVKQAIPYLRCVGESHPLSKERMNYEIDSLLAYSRYAKAHVPNIFHANKEMSLVVMQYLGDHKILRKGLIAGEYYPNFADHISTFLANVLFQTSSFALSSTEKRKLMDQFNGNTELCHLTENFVFTFGFMPHETNKGMPAMQSEAEKLWKDDGFKKNVLALKYLFMTKAEALIHGDLHTGSIMANPTETYIIDSEFAFFGPMGFDVGALLGNFVLSWVSHFVRSKNTAYQDWLLTTAQSFLTQFEDKFIALWKHNTQSAMIEPGFISEKSFAEYQTHFMKTVLQESVGFAGCKMARRILGIAGAEDTRGIEDISKRKQVETMVLSIAKSFVKHYAQIQSEKDIWELVYAESL